MAKISDRRAPKTIQKKETTTLSQTPKAIHLRELRRLRTEHKMYLISIGEYKENKKLPRSTRKAERKKNKIKLKAYSYGMSVSNNNQKPMPKFKKQAAKGISLKGEVATAA